MQHHRNGTNKNKQSQNNLKVEKHGEAPNLGTEPETAQTRTGNGPGGTGSRRTGTRFGTEAGTGTEPGGTGTGAGNRNGNQRG